MNLLKHFISLISTVITIIIYMFKHINVMKMNYIKVFYDFNGNTETNSTNTLKICNC